MSHEQEVSKTETLPANLCWALLRDASVGRLAIWMEDHPDIFPINYVVDHSTIIIRTAPGTKLTGAIGSAPVAFEVDGVDERNGTAWSVVAKGAADVLSSTEDVLESFSLKLFPLEPGHKDAFVRIIPTSVTGRRFSVANPGQWWTAQTDSSHSSQE